MSDTKHNLPAKAWCKAQREYLAKFDDRPITDGLFAARPKVDVT